VRHRVPEGGQGLHQEGAQGGQALVSHLDWIPTIVEAAGGGDIKAKLKKGHEANGKKFKVHLDGFNLLPYLTGKMPRHDRHVYLLVPAQAGVAEFLKTFKEFPPRQKTASFGVDQVMEKMQEAAGGAGR